MLITLEMIQITINDQSRKINEQSSIESLFLEMNQTKRGIAAAVNGKVIPKSDWPNFQLNENDHLLIIKATQGG